MAKKQTLSRRQLLAGASIAGVSAAAGFLSPAYGATGSIKIGHQCDLTGPLADNGYWRKKTVDAAARWINANGGVAGRQLEVITVDTECKVDVGVLRLRQLLQDNAVDFVIGSQHGGVSIASNPILLEQKTLCMSLSRTDEVTGKVANPYIFRFMVNTALAAHAAGNWMVKSTGKRWALICADYVWGHGHRDAWVEQLKAANGEAAAVVPIPVNTADPISFVSRIDRSVDAIFVALLGPDLPRVLIALDQLGFGAKTKVVVDAGFGLVEILKFGKQVDGAFGMDSTPFELADIDTPHQRNMRDAIGLDPMNYEVGTKRWGVAGDIWPAWASMSFIKQTVEKSGWQSRDHTAGLIKYAEANPNWAESEFFPQGPVYIRPQDHQGFCNYYALKIEGGRIRVKSKIEKEKGFYPAVVNLQK